jgi:GNAT superfamily N-acetyltransferase
MSRGGQSRPTARLDLGVGHALPSPASILDFAMVPLPRISDGAVEARAFQAKDETGVIELLRVAFGAWPRGIEGVTPGEFFRWKHMEGRFGPSILVVAVAGDAVVGFVAYLPWQLSVGGHVVLTMRGVDFAVHPSFRRRGVSMAMRAAADLPGDAAFTWSNPNDQSRPGGLTWGQREVRGLPYFVRPGRHPRLTVKRTLAKGDETPRHLSIDADSAGEVLGDETHESLRRASAAGAGQRLSTVRDLAYLRWRYGQLSEYRAIRSDSQGASGMAIFRTRRHGRFWVSHICELLAADDDHRTVRRLADRVCDAASTDFFSCSFLSRRSAAACGFVPYRSRNVLMVYPLQLNLVPDPTQRASWALSLGDLDLL